MRSACAAREKRQRTGVDPASAGLEQQVDARRDARERLADDVDEPGRHHGIERAVGERRLQRIGGDQLEAGARRRRRGQPPQHGVILDAARRDREIRRARALRPANISRATNSSSGLKSVATVSGASPAACRSYASRPAPAPCTSVRPSPLRVAAEHRDDLGQAGRFSSSPQAQSRCRFT